MASKHRAKLFHVKHSLPDLDRTEFRDRLLDAPVAVDDRLVDRLHCHYGELRRWNERIALVGRGGGCPVERHYLESLHGAPLVEPGAALVDVGSGAGFPGFVLAATGRPADVYLVEPRAKKRVFLERTSRLADLEVEIVAEPVERTLPRTLPARIDCLTLRALKLSTAGWRALLTRLDRNSRVLIWSGATAPEELPRQLELLREHPIPGSNVRRIRDYRLSPGSIVQP